MVEVENQLLQAVLWSLYMHGGTHAHICTQIIDNYKKYPFSLSH